MGSSRVGACGAVYHRARDGAAAGTLPTQPSDCGGAAVREVTVAAAQFACVRRPRRERRHRRAPRARGGRAGAQIVCLQELFETPYFCTRRPAPLRPRAPRRGPPHRRALPGPVPRARRRRPGELLRARRARLLQLRRRRRRRRLGARHLPQEPHPRRPRLPREVLLQPGNTGFRVWDDAHGAHRRRHLLGPVVPGVRPRHGAAGRRAPPLPRPASATSPSEYFEPAISDHWQIAMRGHAAANVMPVVAANRIGSEDGPTGHADLLGSVVHRRAARRAAGRRAARRGGDRHRRPSTSTSASSGAGR